MRLLCVVIVFLPLFFSCQWMYYEISTEPFSTLFLCLLFFFSDSLFHDETNKLSVIMRLEVVGDEIDEIICSKE